MSEHITAARAALARIFDRHAHVLLAFSGGKDSLALLRLCEPWRERVTLLWSNTGHMAPHAADFVRSHGERFSLAEVGPERPMADQWEEHGVPAEILPLDHLEGVDRRQPRLQPWPACCGANRVGPVIGYAEGLGEPCALIFGQRHTDRGGTVAGLRSVTVPRVEIAMPLWGWTDADVLAFVSEEGIALAPFHDEVGASLECIVCPIGLTPAKLRLIGRMYPEAAASAQHAARQSLSYAAAKATEILDTLNAVPAIAPEVRP